MLAFANAANFRADAPRNQRDYGPQSGRNSVPGVASMRTRWVFALALVFLCPLNAFGFPSVSPFWGAPTSAWLNDLRSDYPLNSPSVEWSYFGRRPDADTVRRFAARHASPSITVVRAFYVSSRMNLARNATHPVQRRRSCAPDSPDYMAQHGCLFGWSLSSPRQFLCRHAEFCCAARNHLRSPSCSCRSKRISRLQWPSSAGVADEWEKPRRTCAQSMRFA